MSDDPDLWIGLWLEWLTIGLLILALGLMAAVSFLKYVKRRCIRPYTR